jgi:Uma2 family endonuclease
MATLAQTRPQEHLQQPEPDAASRFPVKVKMPFRFRPEPPWDEDELLAFNSANEHLQWEMESDGTIVMMTPAGYDGNRRENFVGRELDFWAESDGRGEAFGCNAGFKLLDSTIRSPDAGWISSKRLEGVSRAAREKHIPRCPEFVVEVLSASDSLSQTEEKMQMWMANGAELGWLIDPFAATVTVYRTGSQPERLDRPAEMRGEGCVAGFVLKMDRLWA